MISAADAIPSAIFSSWIFCFDSNLDLESKLSRLGAWTIWLGD